MLRRFDRPRRRRPAELSHASQEVFLGGMFTQVRLMNTKKARNGNSRYAACKLEDFTGTSNASCGPTTMSATRTSSSDDRICFVTGIVEKDREEPILQVTKS